MFDMRVIVSIIVGVIVGMYLCQSLDLVNSSQEQEVESPSLEESTNTNNQ